MIYLADAAKSAYRCARCMLSGLFRKLPLSWNLYLYIDKRMKLSRILLSAKYCFFGLSEPLACLVLEMLTSVSGPIWFIVNSRWILRDMQSKGK